MANVIRPGPMAPRIPQAQVGAAKYWYSKPLCHSIWFGVTQLGTTLHQKSNPQKWHGKVVLILAKGVIKTGYALNIVVASVQLAGSCVFGIPFFIAANVIFRGNRFDSKMNSYLVHISTIISLQNSLLKKGTCPNKFAQSTYLSHYIQLKESVSGYSLYERIKRLYRREEIPRAEAIRQQTEKIMNFYAKLAPKICKDVIESAARDLSLRNVIYVNHTSFLNFVQQSGYDIHAIETDQINKAAMILFNQYLLEEMARKLNISRQQTLELLKGNVNLPGYPILEPDELDLNRIAIRPRPEEIQPGRGRNPFRVYGENEHDKLFKAYQNKLKAFIIDAYIDLYDQPDFLRMLSLEKDPDAALGDGRERLENSLAVPQLANYSILKEIEKEIECPKEFKAAELLIYNNRSQLLNKSRETYLNQLTPTERKILIHKLLKLGSYDIHAQGIEKSRADLIQALFNDIGELANPLHKGKLLIQKVVNVELLQAGRVHEAFDAQNLFQGACNEAQAKIDARR